MGNIFILEKSVTTEMMHKVLLISVCIVVSSVLKAHNELLVEAELFDNKGGWVTETQFVNQMGSPYLMAHGLGKPVEDASTRIIFPNTGKYHVWIRTKDWAPFPVGPGEFQLLFNGKKLETNFGSSGIQDWRWYYGGLVDVESLQNEIKLHDLTGFAGRCDAIFFSTNRNVRLPDTVDELSIFRKKYLSFSSLVHNEGSYDLVVVGGGVAGVCAAIQAARLGLRVALINNRPVLGGNSSSEIRVSTEGDVFRNKYSVLGRIVREIDNNNAGIANENSKLYRDDWRKSIVLNEKNISLFENMHINQVEMNEKKIKSVTALNLNTLEKHRFKGKLFSDCTGDGDLGLLAGADHRYGRESREETGESMAPEQSDLLVMGSSNQWYAKYSLQAAMDFPIKPWMLQFSDSYHFELYRSRWNWETGFNNFHTVQQAEEIRDHNFRAIFGNWAFLKTYKSSKFKNQELSYVSYIAGKRESYRLLGDIILTQKDIENQVEYPDAIVTTTWGIDLHYPDSTNSYYFPGQEFIAYAQHAGKRNTEYTFPYRCLYSRNIENLFMAGRNISVTHIALGAVRVQHCTGMMGEVVGIASYICNKFNCSPRDVYVRYWSDMLSLVN